MNANELADKLDWHWDNDCRSPAVSKAAEMLRQLQAENDALRKTVDSLFAGLDSSLALNKAQVERNNEPVAYVNSMCNDYIDWKVEPMSIDGQSLYTHPVKELTDEEIRHIQAICHLKDVGYDNFIMRFARAILRKAQEK
jgi:hypothetical protein